MIRSVLASIVLAWTTRRTRRELHALSDWALRDIGLRRDEIDRLRL